MKLERKREQGRTLIIMDLRILLLLGLLIIFLVGGIIIQL